MNNNRELLMVQEGNFDFVIYEKNKPNRLRKIVARFTHLQDAQYFMASFDMYDALKTCLNNIIPEPNQDDIDSEGYIRPEIQVRNIVLQALAKAEGKT